MEVIQGTIQEHVFKVLSGPKFKKWAPSPLGCHCGSLSKTSSPPLRTHRTVFFLQRGIYISILSRQPFSNRQTASLFFSLSSSNQALTAIPSFLPSLVSVPSFVSRALSARHDACRPILLSLDGDNVVPRAICIRPIVCC